MSLSGPLPLWQVSRTARSSKGRRRQPRLPQPQEANRTAYAPPWSVLIDGQLGLLSFLRQRVSALHRCQAVRQAYPPLSEALWQSAERGPLCCDGLWSAVIVSTRSCCPSPRWPSASTWMSADVGQVRAAPTRPSRACPASSSSMASTWPAAASPLGPAPPAVSSSPAWRWVIARP